MEISFVVEQLLNGFQLGVLLFLLAAGLTLVFGIMDLVNLAHGSIYMIGAFFAATMTLALDSFILGIIIALPMTLVLGMVLEFIALRTLYSRGHMDQVLATFGLILFLNELVRIIWGPAGLAIPLPLLLDGSISLPLGIVYPTYRMFIILIGIIVAIGLYYLVSKTRLGMLIRAGASNRTMVGALGINIRLLFTAVFGLGAMLAGLAGMLIAPINQAQIGMGEDILILAFVVIVIGGIGSIRGAFIAAIVAGVIDTMGRAFLDVLLLALLPANAGEAAGPALSSMLIYFLMAVVLIFRPQGLFPARNG